jgi:hypothetical protein
MSRAREAAERTARLAEHHIVEQEARIERLVSLVAKLERDGHIAMLKEDGVEALLRYRRIK